MAKERNFFFIFSQNAINTVFFTVSQSFEKIFAVLLNILGKKVDYLPKNVGLKTTASAIDDAVATLGIKANFEPTIIA